MQYKFTIQGNEADPMGNPRPKLKMMKSQQWTPKAQSYVKWKEKVVADFIASIPQDQRRYFLSCHAINKKPILEAQNKLRMDLKLHFKSKAHPDPENVFGSIADALFKQDKHLVGSFDFDYSEDKIGSVDVIITI